MKSIFYNVKELLQVRTKDDKIVRGADMKKLPSIKDAYLIIQDDRILDFGHMKDCPKLESEMFEKIIDTSGRMILPSWCDSHTHLVYAGNRESEFIDRLNGLSYQEIAEKGGGILNSAKKLQESTEKELYDQSKLRLEAVIQMGTGAIEIKSGYGLTPEAELKMLRVIKRLKEEYEIPIRSTFLAAHALPKAYVSNKQAFLDLMMNETLPKIKEESLAQYIDVFCEKGYFDIKEMEFVLKAASRYGLKPKVHVNQFNAFGGVSAAVALNAKSVDHLEILEDEDVDALRGSECIPVALPACSFFLGIPYTDGRTLMNAGLPLALASDFNPGSSPSGNMNFVISLACIKMKMTPEEAINAATLNGAYAMDLEHEVGSITIGKKANLILTKELSSIGFLPYSFGSSQIDAVYINGKIL